MNHRVLEPEEAKEILASLWQARDCHGAEMWCEQKFARDLELGEEARALLDAVMFGQPYWKSLDLGKGGSRYKLAVNARRQSRGSPTRC